MPAQLTAIRSGRSLPVASSIAACTDASSVTSVRTNVVCPPSSVASAFPRSSLRSSTVTATPAAVSARVVASPRPEAPPVTTAATSRFFMPARLARARTGSGEAGAEAGLGGGQPLLDPLGIGDRADHSHVRGVNHHAVPDADQGDQVVGVVAERDVAGAGQQDGDPAGG